MCILSLNSDWLVLATIYQKQRQDEKNINHCHTTFCLGKSLGKLLCKTEPKCSDELSSNGNSPNLNICCIREEKNFLLSSIEDISMRWRYISAKVCTGGLAGERWMFQNKNIKHETLTTATKYIRNNIFTITYIWKQANIQNVPWRLNIGSIGIYNAG